MNVLPILQYLDLIFFYILRLFTWSLVYHTELTCNTYQLKLVTIE